MDPLVGEHDAVGRHDLVAERNRPAVLDQSHRGALPLRDRIGDVPDVRVVEQVPVGELGGTSPHGGFELFVTSPRADQAADDRPEVLGLARAEVAGLDRLELAVDVPDDHQVDQPDDVRLLEPLELRHDRAVEAGAVEPEHEQLHWAEGQRGRSLAAAHDTPASSLAFCASNSAWVRMPWSLSAARFWNCSTMSVCGAAAGAGAAGAACCASSSAIRASRS